MDPTLDIAVFAPGTFPSCEGENVTFTPQMLQEMARNTNYLIDIGVLTPPIKYDHPVWGDRSKDAHGHAVRTEVHGGVFISKNAKPSRRLIGDVEEGRRLRGSGEFFAKYKYADRDGTPRELGPVYVGYAALGADRPAMRTENIPDLMAAIKKYRAVPVDKLSFGEGVSDVDAHYLRAELRRTGVVAHYFAEDGAYCFSEIQFDPQVFKEENEHMPLTAEELAQIRTMVTDAASAAVTTAVAPLKQDITTLKQDTDTAVKQFSEAAKTESKINQVMENLRADKKHFGKAAMDNLEAALREPTFERVKAFAESVPSVIVSGDRAGGGGDNDGEAPLAIARLRPEDFIKKSENDGKISAGLKAFSEDPRYKDQWSLVADKPLSTKHDALLTIVKQVNAGSN